MYYYTQGDVTDATGAGLPSLENDSSDRSYLLCLVYINKNSKSVLQLAVYYRPTPFYPHSFISTLWIIYPAPLFLPFNL